MCLGVQVSVLCLGCMNFGGPTAEAEAFNIIDRALDGGINFLDTANVYSRGISEEIVGKALKRNGKRDRIVLATKVHGRMADDDVLAAGNNRRHIIQQCEASLRRLQMDYIDLYQIHRPQSNTPIDETLRALDDLVQTGKGGFVLIGGEGIGQVVVETSKDGRSASRILRNHGVFAIGETAEDAVKEAVMTEDNAAIVWTAMQLGAPLTLNPSDIDKLCYRYQNVYTNKRGDSV